MSLLDSSEESNGPTPVSTIVAHCNSCNQDYYLMAQPGQTQEELLAQTTCNCANSDIVAKATTDGIATVETKDNVATD